MLIDRVRQGPAMYSMWPTIEYKLIFAAFIDSEQMLLSIKTQLFPR